MRTFRQRQRTSGVSIIEILLAIVVLVFGLLGVMTVIDANERNTHRATENFKALELARMKAAEFRAAGGPALARFAAGEQPAQATPFAIDPYYRWQATLTRDEAASQIVYRLKVFVRDEQESRAELTGFINFGP